MERKYEDLIREAAREGAKAGAREVMEALQKKEAEEMEARRDYRFQNTKLLLSEYRTLKLHARDGIDELSKINEEDEQFFAELMSNRGRELTVESITRSKARTAIMLRHVDAMLELYKEICQKSKNPDDRRRYSVLDRLCLTPKKMTMAEIAEADGTYERAIYRDYDAAVKKMSIMLFGIPWFGAM